MNGIHGSGEYANKKAGIVRNILVHLQELLQDLDTRSSMYHDLHKTIDCMQESLNTIKTDLKIEADKLVNSFAIVRNHITQTNSSLRSIEKIIEDKIPESVNTVQIPSFSRVNLIFRKYSKMRRKAWRKQTKALAELTEEVNDPARPWEVIQFHFETDDNYHQQHKEGSSGVYVKKLKLSRASTRCETADASKQIAVVNEEDELFAQFLEQEAERYRRSKDVMNPRLLTNRECVPVPPRYEHRNNKTPQESEDRPAASTSVLQRNMTETVRLPYSSRALGNLAKDKKGSTGQSVVSTVSQNGVKKFVCTAPSPALTLQKEGSTDVSGTASPSVAHPVLQELSMNKPSTATRSTNSKSLLEDREAEEDTNVEKLAAVQKIQAKEYTGPKYVTFEAMELVGALLSGLHIWGIANPKPLQQSLVPCILTGRDTIVESVSLSGKTTAAIVSALQIIDYTVVRPQIIHLQPTAETANKTLTKITEIGTWLDVKVSCFSKTDGLPDTCQIFIGTPSRVRELIVQRQLSTDLIKMLIIDTADAVLATSSVLVGKLLYLLPNPERVQVVVLTEKVTKEVSALVSNLKTPEYIQFLEDKCASVEVTSDRRRTPPIRPPSPDEIEIIYSSVEEATQKQIKEFKNLSQTYEVVENDDVKIKVLHELSDLMETEQAIIFCNSGAKADWLACKIREYQKDLEVCSVHGQCGNRDYLVELFRGGVSRVLITTDFITRWNVNLIPVPLVLNFEFPEVPEQYMQRLTYAGRAAKAGNTPPPRVLMFSFVSDAHLSSLNQLSQKYNFRVSPMSYRC